MANSSAQPDSALNELVGLVVDAAMEVHRRLGPGFLESVYEEALSLELTARNIPFHRQVRFAVEYREQPVGEGYVDLLVGERLVVELKAVERLAPVHLAQMISYLRATANTLGLLINFNERLLVHGLKRVIFTAHKN